MNIIKKTMLLLFTGVLFLTSVHAQEQQVLMMKMGEFKTALIRKDSVTLSRLLSDDVSYGHSNGLLQSKAQLIRDVVSGVQDYKSIEPSNMSIHIYDNTGVITMQSKISMSMQGKPLDLSMNVLWVWIMQNKEWKMVARQSVKNN
jgi:hypothetical protein